MKKNKKTPITYLDNDKKNKLAFLLISIAVICISGFIVYSNIYGNTRHFDDIAFMEPYGLKSFEGVKDFLKINPLRIITYLSFSLNYQISGMQLPAYYFFNVLVHVINGLLVFSLLLMIFQTPLLKNSELYKNRWLLALFGSLLFVVHPMQTQAVTYIYQRLTSLAAMFYLATICMFIKARLSQVDESPKPYLYFGMVLAAILSFFTKENTYTLPMTILLFELVFFRPKLKISWNASTIGLMAILLGIVLVFSMTGPNRLIITMFTDSGVEINSRNYLLTQFKVIPDYVRMLIFPANQNLDYDINLSTTFFDFWTIAGFMFNAGLVSLALFLYNKKRLVSFSIFWFYITLIIESSIIPILDVKNEHRLYLPMFGFVLIISVLLYEYVWKRSVPVAITIMSVIIILFGYLTYERNTVWHDEITLWTDVINKSPNKTRPYNNRGLAFLAGQKYSEAIADFSSVIKIDNKNANAYNNRGFAYFASGNIQNAIADYTVALSSNPNNPDALINRGNVYTKSKEFEKAISDFTRFIMIQPNSTDGYYHRANTYTEAGLIDSAVNDYQKIIQLSPGEVKAYLNLGDLMLDSGNLKKAVEAYTSALAIEPSNYSIHNNLASAYYFAGEYDKSADEYKRAIGYKPDFIEAYVNLAGIYEKREEFPRAIETYTSAIGYHQGNPNLYYRRAENYSRLKNFVSAEADLNEALRIAPNFRKAKQMLDSVKLLINE